MRTLSGRLLLALAVTVWASSVSAQRITTPYRFVDEGQSLTPFAGYLVADQGLLDLGPESSPGFGLGYVVRLSGPLSADLSAIVLPTTRMVFDTIPADTAALINDPTVGLAPIGEADLTMLLVSATLRFDITGPRTFHNVMPYALFGGGLRARLSSADTLDVDIDPQVRSNIGTSFAGTLGAGLEWFLSQRITARVEARDVFWKLGIPEGMQRSRVIPEDEWVQNLFATFGLSYRF